MKSGWLSWRLISTAQIWSAASSVCLTADACAGVFTSPLLLPYLADTFDRLGMLGRLTDFATGHGHRFYGLPPIEERVALRRGETPVPEAYEDVVPFRAGQTLAWSIEVA